MDELARQVNYVLGHFGIKSFIGFGVGAGANILARFALTHPQQVDALVLVNCTSNQAGWIEWAYQKFNSRLLRTRGMTYAVLDYLMWHHFGRMPEERNQDLTQMYRSYFTRNVNATNLALFIDSYVRRGDLAIGRDADTLKVPVLNITGALSPHVEDTVTFNSRLNPSTSTWMKLSDCGLPLEEQPEKLAEAFRLFLQGEGYVAPLSPTKIVLYRRLSDAGLGATVGSGAIVGAGGRRRCRHSPIIRITENPIPEAVVC
ncbi:unnamed protein product [Chilo suppressalis]|uniref:Protein NDRG3 n=1 Tax=Chilo suppressalis TaxID=168631 RepID=A0ABN8B7H8_CHISP|nr:unnamed protein product [Chilo suppressalis]